MKTLTGAEFKYTVHKAKLTIAAVVEEAGVPVSNVSKWINGKQDIMLAGTYNKLIAAYEKLKED